MGATIGVDVTKVRTSAEGPEFKLGTRAVVETSDGSKGYIYGQARGAVTGAGYVCVAQTGFDFAMATVTETAPGTTGPGSPVGVAMAAMADNGYGWFQISGKGTVRTLASAAKGTRLNSTATAGCLDDDGTASSEQILGVVLGTATGGAEANNADAYLTYPVVGVTL